MSAPVLFSLSKDDPAGPALGELIGAERGEIEVRRFPDGETYLRYGTEVKGRSVILFYTLDRPDEKILPLLFAAATARELGAMQVGLVAPYLAYMRQDRRFHDGEAVTSARFAKILSEHVDWLVTVDPHLHRRGSLGEIYSIPAVAVHAAPLISKWITRMVSKPLLIGPDQESEQWVASVAQAVGAPHVILEKVRRGDREVEVSLPAIERWRDRTPVLVDDIVSTARTMIETVRHLKSVGLSQPVCIAVHGVFAGEAFRELIAAGAGRVVSTNTIPHESNEIDVTPILAEGVRAVAGPGLPA